MVETVSIVVKKRMGEGGTNLNETKTVSGFFGRVNSEMIFMIGDVKDIFSLSKLR